MITFPYGIWDFHEIATRGYYYCDRTQAIPYLERTKSSLFIRPRRFGKSLLLSMLENYYDIALQDQFPALFGHLAIGADPTPLRNSYFILRWDFSCVDPTGSQEDMRQSLYDHINDRIKSFLIYYADRGFDLRKVQVREDNALSSVESLLAATQSAGHPVYLLIDEYDNFANTVMMLTDQDSQDRYEALVHDEGILRTLFKVIKASTQASMFDRVFITGVSPVVMNDLTSGYNVAEDIFFEPEFADLCGFREEEVAATLQAVADQCGLGRAKGEEALDLLRTYYNGYNFVPKGATVVYNPTLCLYFFKHFQKRCAYPDKMLDANLAMDQSKLEYVAALPGGREMITALAHRDQQVTVPDIADRFGLREMLSDSSKDQTFLASFLYYFGVLTLAGETDTLQLTLRVPNLVIQGLYVHRLRQMLLPDAQMRDAGRWAAEKVYQDGELAPLCAFVQENLFTVFKNRDYAQANELTVKTAFLALLYNDLLFIMDSEPELERRYADLTMIIRPDKRHGRLVDVLMEFKFLSLKDLGLSGEALRAMSEGDLDNLPQVGRALNQATAQARDYAQRLHRKYPALRLHAFVVVALGFERICWAKVAP